MRSVRLSVVALLFLSGCVQGIKINTIAEKRVREMASHLSGPEFSGRGTGAPGYMAAVELTAGMLKDIGFKPLPGNEFIIPFSWQYKGSETLNKSANVVGWIPGESDEVVLIGAHLDHVGCATETCSVYYPGADDNASGVTAVMEIARAFAKEYTGRKKPKRGIVVAFWGAEERGLIGSGFFVNRLMSDTNPYPFKLGNITLLVNLDMVGRSYEDEEGAGRTKTTLVIGPPASQREDIFARRSPDIYRLLNKYLKIADDNLRLRYDDNNMLYMRTDSYSFSKQRIELATLAFAGPLHKDYHAVTDTAEKLDYPRLLMIARLAHLIVRDVVNSDDAPKVDLN